MEVTKVPKKIITVIEPKRSMTVDKEKYRQKGVAAYCRVSTDSEEHGTNLSLGEQLEKHLLLHFPFIKEAFFARCAIFVEGDSEYGSFPLFAKKCDIDLDDCGICVIQAGGDSVLQLIQLAEKFCIPCIGIRDSRCV